MIDSGTSLLIPMDEPSRVGEARRAAQRLALQAGCDEPLLGRIGIVVTEAATNLAKHARRGALVLRADAEPEPRLDLISFDHGPGMADVERCLADGFSTEGTAGNGLGAIRRLADRFQIYSQPGKGTVLSARLGGSSVEEQSYRAGAISVCAKGENRCGDGWAVQPLPDRIRAVVVDGLGHGPLAGEAADAAIRVFRKSAGLTLLELLHAQHTALRGTRGAALAVADIFPDKRLRFAGVGNISGFLVGPRRSHGLMSHAGIVGHELARSVELEFAWPDHGALILHSDGLSAKWNLDAYPGLLAQHPSIIAATLYRENVRGRDDATILVLTLP
ncbi:serine/threonine protein kinase [Opitutaceae bacterium EW11]|nr:serine/threonine protein kinase [Opitutaceae bacterium EW11]